MSASLNIKLSQALVPHESGVAYILNQESTPTSIAELLRNYVFGSSPDIFDSWLLGTLCHLIKSTTQSETSSSKPIEELFIDFKRQVLLVPFYLHVFLASAFIIVLIVCLC